ncbi:MAG: tetratricopeptide repeat protein [Thermoanaerobaculaceae bacterium]|nr:tetratricopeptide repeat protein [Thermoanaerobaculaceae bacterium]
MEEPSLAPGVGPEGQPEELAPPEPPAEPLSVAPEPGSPEEEALAVAPVEVSLAEPEVAAVPDVVLVAESGQPEEAPRVVAVEEPPVEPEAAEGGAGGDLEPEASDARPLNPPEVEEGAVREAPGPAESGEEPPASITLARLYLHQQQMDAAVEVLERLLGREPDNQEARDLLVLVRDLMEEVHEPQASALSVGERKIAALQRWLARIEPGRERMTP